MSIHFGRLQLLTLRRLRDDPSPDEERALERRRAWRRLVSCGLTLLLAVLMVVLLVVYEARVARIIEENEVLEGEAKTAVKIWGWMVIAILLLLLVVIGLAAADLWETRRYGLK